MESKKEKFNVNNYVIFKYGNECLEGRIKSVTVEGTSEMFVVYCFSNFQDLRICSTDILSNMSAEVKRKMKTAAYHDYPAGTYFPPAMKHCLVIDKEWSAENRYEVPPKIPASVVLKQFRDFLVNQTNSCDADEANEAVKGFTLCLNTFLRKFLLYSPEVDYYNNAKGEPIDYCAPVHLVRLVYYIQKNISKYITDVQVAGVVLDYTIYLLDFLCLRYKDFFLN